MLRGLFNSLILLTALTVADELAMAQNLDGNTFESARAIIGQIESLPDSQRGKPAQAQLVDELGNTVESIALADLNSADGGARDDRVERLRHDFASLPQDWVKQDAEFTGMPFVMEADFLAGHTVFVSFTAVWGGAGAPYLTHWLWAFQERNGKFERVGELGDDLSDAGLIIEPLPAGRSGEVWFLVWGKISGANQTPLRTRVFSFDGDKFATLWSPPSYAQMRVRRTPDGFETHFWDPVQRYQLHQSPYIRYERYVMTVQGVFQQESYLTNQLEFGW